MRRNEPYSNSRGLDNLLGDSARGKLGSSWESIEPEPPRSLHTMFGDRAANNTGAPTNASAATNANAGRPPRGRRAEPVEDDSAVKKFGSAKAISSAQFFGEQVTYTML